MNYLVFITVDENDGDYITEQRFFNQEDFNKLLKIFTKLKDVVVNKKMGMDSLGKRRGWRL